MAYRPGEDKDENNEKINKGKKEKNAAIAARALEKIDALKAQL